MRAERIVKEYFDSSEKLLEIEKVIGSYILKNRLGQKNIDFMKDCMKKGEYVELVEVLLEKYYDPMYNHSQKRMNEFATFSSNNIDDAVTQIRDYASQRK